MVGLPVEFSVSVRAGADGFDVRPIRRPTQIEGGGRIAPFGVIGQIFELAEIDCESACKIDPPGWVMSE